jgi:hypothetical protein
MTTLLDELHRDEERVLDRLVDGQLTPAQRRELLAALRSIELGGMSALCESCRRRRNVEGLP